MATWKEMTYMVLDELKLTSDDDLFNEEHVFFLLKKYRAFVIRKEYERLKKEKQGEELSLDNYQQLCLDLEQVAAINGELCEGGVYLRSTEKIPTLLEDTEPLIYTEDFFQSEIVYVPKQRFKYVGHNKWLLNFIYATIGPDNYLYLTSSNPQLFYLDKIKMSVVLEDPTEASDLLCCSDDSICDILDSDFSISEYLIPQVLNLTVQELLGKIYNPRDKQNNAEDNLSGLAATKSDKKEE